MVLLRSESTNPEEFLNQESRATRPNGLQDEDFIKVFEPVLKVQIILGSSRVNVKNASITPLTLFQKCYTILCIIIMIISLLQLLISYMAKFSDSRKMFYLWVAGILAVIVVFSGLIMYARFYDNEGNLSLYITMQEIDRLMGTNREINIMLHKQNQKAAYSLAIGFAVIFVLSYILARNEFGILELFGATYTMMSSVLELTCCSSHISFFYTRVRQLNSQISKHIRREPSSIAALNTGPRAGDGFILSAETENPATDIHLKEIYKGYMLFKQQYRFQMFLFCAIYVAWILFTFEHGILAMQSDHPDKTMFLLDFLFLLSFVFVDLLLLLVLSIGSEAYMREVRKTKHLSILILCRYVDGPLRRKAKNMMKLIEETPPSFSVFGMWRMDAQLVLDIFNVVTSFILVIIQFTFL